MPVPRRILILTAAFGEGHNSAARNLALALEAAGAQCRVADPCMAGAPRLTALVNRGYRLVTNRFPSLWARIYHSTDRFDFNRKESFLLRLPENAQREMIAGFQPDAVVCTYPLYPYFMPRIDGKLPVFTVVTDSIEINSAWLRAPGNAWLVTDRFTREAMLRAGLPPASVVETGFPVHPAFATLEPLPAKDGCAPFRILCFPTARISQMQAHARALLDSSPAVRLTLVLGRNTRRLLPAAQKIKASYPGRVRLLGWTRRVPRLLASHHLTVGKAGGATVHEAIAAQCPMLIHHLVPGQEEGNLRLLETIGGGSLADSPPRLAEAVRNMLAQDARGWRAMKQSLAAHSRNRGAANAAEWILATLDGRRPLPEMPS